VLVLCRCSAGERPLVQCLQPCLRVQGVCVCEWGLMKAMVWQGDSA